MARAPVVVIGRVVKVELAGRAGVFTDLVARFKVLAVFRGKVAPGSALQILFSLRQKRMPPSVTCHYSRKSIRPDQVYLLFLAPGYRGRGHRLAAYGCRVLRLDNGRVIGRLNEAARRVRLQGRLRARLLEAYQWAAGWVKNRKAIRSKKR